MCNIRNKILFFISFFILAYLPTVSTQLQFERVFFSRYFSLHLWIRIDKWISTCTKLFCPVKQDIAYSNFQMEIIHWKLSFVFAGCQNLKRILKRCAFLHQKIQIYVNIIIKCMLFSPVSLRARTELHTCGSTSPRRIGTLRGRVESHIGDAEKYVRIHFN